jgi:diguanylate cyclase (GGDEF)-like protein/PAS domain S-box-containing protein
MQKTIAKHKKIEEKLRIFQSLVNQSNDAIFLIDAPTSHFLEVNERACESLGYTRQELLNMHVTDIEAVITDNLSWRRHVQQVREKGSMILEGEHKRKDNTSFPVEISVRHIMLDREYILAVVRDITERKKFEERLIILANYDELTGCVNFRWLMKLLEKEIARSRRYRKEFSIIMIDIDHFKIINDTHGHLVGNDALVAFANLVKGSVRSIDIVGRYGGEEFLIILPESDAQQALVVLERLKNNLTQTKITSPHLGERVELSLKFSAGIASFPLNTKNLKELIWIADNALRQAKREGRNRVVLERRRQIRLKPLSGYKIELVDPYTRETSDTLEIANISRGGLLLLSHQDIPGDNLLCRMHCPEDNFSFEFSCRIAHKNKSGDDRYRVGLYFVDNSEHIQEKLSSCINSPRKLN